MGVLIFILGSIIGSFLNVCIYRIPKEESIAYPPSHCMNCENELKWYDLVPIVSYIFLKGRCRYCREKVSIRYPIIELTTGLLFLALYINYGLSFYLVKYAVFVCLIIVIGMIDYDTTDVYFSITVFGSILGVIFIAVEFYLYKIGIIMEFNFLTYVYGAILAGGIIGIIILLTHGMGLGDIEICFVCGLFLGFKLSVLMMFLSFIIGGILGVLLIALKIKNRKDYIPFGPFVTIAALIAILYGEKIINLYLGTI